MEPATGDETMPERVYADWNATAPLRPEARDAMIAVFGPAVNPSSVHTEGRAARRIVDTARAQVAALVGATPQQVVFTGGGTEANALALSPALQPAGAKAGEPFQRLAVSAVEHPSVLSGGRFAKDAIVEVPVTQAGVIDVDALDAILAKGPRALVSVMLANNETGVVQPISEVAERVHANGGLLHVDAVQAAGKIAIDINALGADLYTITAHKLGGPQGVGALILRQDIGLDPLVVGGGQERGRRPGTESVAAIAGFGAAAAEAAKLSATDSMRARRDRLEAELLAQTPGAVVVGQAAPDRLPNTTLIAVPGLKGETAVIALDLAGVAVSSGSACSSGKVTSSHVLHAMGLDPDLARGAVRLTLGWTTTEVDLDILLRAWNKVVPSLLRGQSSIAA